MITPELIWFLIGLVLVLAEFATPGVILVFFGLGAWVTSFTCWMGWTSTLASQSTMFTGSSVVLLLGLRRFFKQWFLGRATPGGSEALVEEYIGKTAKALTAFSAGGTGKVEFKGAHWTAESETDVVAGSPVIITSRDGIALKVRAK